MQFDDIPQKAFSIYQAFMLVSEHLYSSLFMQFYSHPIKW